MYGVVEVSVLTGETVGAETLLFCEDCVSSGVTGESLPLYVVEAGLLAGM